MNDIQDFINKNKDKLYLICFIPRSGSNHLTSIMEENGLGAPTEYYYPYDFKSRYKYWNKLLPYYFREENEYEFFKSIFKVKKDGGCNNITGMKISLESLNIMLSEIKNVIYELNPKFIYLTRNNKLMQSISWFKAENTKIWSSDDLINNPQPELKYDRNSINQYLQMILYQEKMFNEFLSDKKHLKIHYEDGVNIKEISSFLGIEPIKCKKTILGDFSILRDNNNTDFYNRYMSETV